MMESKEKYLQFPLFLLRGIFTDKSKTLENIISYGIYRFSKTIKYQYFEVARQLMYCYYRERENIPGELFNMMRRYVADEKINIDECYYGFIGAYGEFNPESEIEEILTIFGYNPMTDEINESESDTEFLNLAIEFYRIRQAFKSLSISGNMPHHLREGKRIEKTIPEGEAYPSINIDKLFEFQYEDKTELELIQFLFYIAIRSIVGIKPYSTTNKKMILFRAFGYKNEKAMPVKMNPAIKELFVKYSKRYHTDKVLELLELKWNVLIYADRYSGLHGMKVAVNSKKTSLEAMAESTERKKMKNQREALKQKKIEAKNKALQQLNKEQQLNKVTI
ncbi:MAG: hypothetical protein ACOYM7_10730 [Paludibacter sp.]